MAGRRAGLAYALARPQRMPAGHLGDQLGGGVGNSIEFMDYRKYEPGDDLRRIDWAAYARSDRLVIKLNREEISPHLDLLDDISRSMAVAQTRKAEATWGLAAALSSAADNARMSRRIFTAGRRLEPLMDSDADPLAWPAVDFVGDASLTDAVHAAAVPLRRRGVRVLISDLLCPDDPEPIVSRLADGASAVTIVQLLARQDAEPAWNGDLRLVDSEAGSVRELRLDATAVARYRQQLDRLRSQWRSACARAGVQLIELIAEPLIDVWDLSPFVEAGLLRPA